MDNYDIAHASAERIAGACTALGIEPTITAEDALANVLCSQSVTSTIQSLRALGVADADIAAAFLSGTRTLIRNLDNQQVWAALLLETSAEVANGR